MTAESFPHYAKRHQLRWIDLPYAPDGDWIEEFAGVMDGTEIGELFGSRLQGLSPFFRHVALDYLAATRREESTAIATAGLTIGDLTVYPKSLRVDGTLENHGVLVVLGDLEVSGNYVALGDHPALYVGGDLRLESYWGMETETICLGQLEFRDIMILRYNHTVTIASRLQGPRLITDDASVDAEILVEEQVSHRCVNAVAGHFGIDTSDYEDDEIMEEEVIEEVLRRLLA